MYEEKSPEIMHGINFHVSGAFGSAREKCLSSQITRKICRAENACCRIVRVGRRIRLNPFFSCKVVKCCLSDARFVVQKKSKCFNKRRKKSHRYLECFEPEPARVYTKTASNLLLTFQLEHKYLFMASESITRTDPYSYSGLDSQGSVRLCCHIELSLSQRCLHTLDRFIHMTPKRVL